MAASPLAAALLGGGGDTSSLAATFLEPTLAQATPNLQLAQAMLQSGLSSAPASPAQAVGRLAQAISGAYLQHKTLGSLAQMYAGTADNLASVFPEGTPVGDMLRNPDPTVRMMGIQQAGKAAILGQQPYTLSPGQERHQGSAAPVASNTQPRSPEGVLQSDIDRRRAAVSGIESGGNYAELGPVTKTGDRAYGKYQVMGANIGPWTQEVLGKAMTPQQFLADPKAQDAVFDAKFGQYAQKYGPQGAARAWFAGEGGMNNPNAHDQLGTSVGAYANKFAAGYGNGNPGVPLNVPQINPGPPAAAPQTAAPPVAPTPQASEKTPPTAVPTSPLQGAIDTQAAAAGAKKAAEEAAETAAAGPKKTAESTAEANAKYYDSLHRGLAGSAMIAAQQKQNIDLLRQVAASPNFTPGVGSDAALQMQRIAAQLGIKTEGAAPREIFNQVAARILADQMSGIKSMASETGEAGGRIFKPMLDLEEKANITPEDTLAGIKAKLNLLDHAGDLMMKWGDMADDYMKANGRLDPGFDKALRAEIGKARIPNAVPTAESVKAEKTAEGTAKPASAAPTGDPAARFKELVSGGMNKQQAFAKMHAEGY